MVNSSTKPEKKTAKDEKQNPEKKNDKKNEPKDIPSETPPEDPVNKVGQPPPLEKKPSEINLKLPPASTITHKEAFGNKKGEKPTKEVPDVPSCPFREFSCDFESKQQKQIQTHIKEQSQKHLSLLCEAVLELLRVHRSTQSLFEKLTTTYDALFPQHDSLVKRYGAHQLWKIDKYEEKLKSAEVGAKNIVFSPPFMTSRHGYHLILSAALYGDGKTARGKFMSVFVSILQGDNDALLAWPFRHSITLTLIDQSGNPLGRTDVSHVVRPFAVKENYLFLTRPTRERNPSFGIQRFIDLDALQNLDYIKEDTLYIKAEVEQDMLDVL